MYLARNLLAGDLGMKSSESNVKLIRELRECFDKGKDHEEVKMLIADVADYRENLKNSGIQDWQVSLRLP